MQSTVGMIRHEHTRRSVATPRCLLVAVGLLCTSFASLDASADSDLPPTPPPRVETLADGFDHPWSIAFLPDGRELVTERVGRLRSLDSTGIVGTIVGVPPVFADSQGGLFDVLPDPDFADNRLVYLSYAHGTPQRNATRVARARLDGDVLSGLQVLFTATPWKDTPVHYGGRMAFLPDGTLLLSVGDGFDYRESAQRLDNHLGKIVRIAVDGSVPADNPFADVAGALPEIYSYGHRNPQGLVVDADGTIYSHEHGPAGGDEINRIEPGKNYGWPIATQGRDYSGAAISPYTGYPGTVAPLVDWTPSIAPGGLALGTGSSFPALEGELLVAVLKTRELRRVQLDEDGQLIGEQTWLEGWGRLRDVRVAPDGSLRVLVDSDDGEVLGIWPD